MATYANLYIDQGADYETVVTIEDSASDPLDLTNLDISGQIRRTYRSDTSYNFVITKESEELGAIRVRLDSETSGQMNYGRYVYDIYAEDVYSNERFKVLEGMVEIVPGVTRNG